MIISRLQGGLGNQMFQYALGRVLSLKNNTELGIDTTFLLDRTPIPNFTFRDYDLDVFNINPKIVSRNEIPYLYRKYKLGVFMRYIDYLRRKILPTPGKEKIAYHFDKKILDTGPDVYLEGWWQSPKYFKGYEDVIKKDFTFKSDWSQDILSLSQEIKNTESVCMFFRRGDFIGNYFHDVVESDYYNKALDLLKSNTKIEKIYVFSDEIEWCKKNVMFPYPTLFVDEKFDGYKYSGKLFLMTCCKNFIIPNSSFSWWGAWLASNPDKIVVCPKKWTGNDSVDTSDLIPQDWIRI
jgi:hypothetical protein